MTNHFEGQDHLSLFFRCWKPSGKSQACLAFVPGNPDHSGRYEHVAHHLTNRGFTVYAMDLRGTGYSEGRRAYADSLEQFVSDVKIFVQMVVRDCAEQKIFLLGHSNGGKIVLKYALQYPDHLHGIIATSPNIQLCLSNTWLQRLFVPVLEKFIPKVVLPNGIKPQFTSHDPAEVEAYRNDPHVHKKMTLRLAYLLIRDDRKLLNDASHFDHRCLLMLGGDDLICSVDATKEFYEQIPNRDKTLKIYKGLYHEILHEAKRDKILEDIVTWIEERI